MGSRVDLYMAPSCKTRGISRPLIPSIIAMRAGPLDTLNAHSWESVREFYRNDRDKWWIYLGLAYIANVLDAYVAANLYDFDVSTPGSSPFDSYYDPIGRRGGISLTLHF